ncbi:MAG: hypothetical protein ACRDU4_16865 [Mycobacterium sp.]
MALPISDMQVAIAVVFRARVAALSRRLPFFHPHDGRAGQGGGRT